MENVEVASFNLAEAACASGWIMAPYRCAGSALDTITSAAIKSPSTRVTPVATPLST